MYYKLLTKFEIKMKKVKVEPDIPFFFLDISFIDAFFAI